MEIIIEVAAVVAAFKFVMPTPYEVAAVVIALKFVMPTPLEELSC